MKNPLTSPGIEPATFRFVAQHLNHCATTVPISTYRYVSYISYGVVCLSQFPFFSMLLSVVLTCQGYILPAAYEWNMRWSIGGMAVIIIIGSTALGGPWPPHTNVASDLYPVHPPANFYNPVSLCLPLPHQSILILVGHFLTDLQGLSMISF